MLVFEVFVVKCLAVGLNKSIAEIAVELSIKHVRYGVARGAGRLIVQQLDGVFIEKQCLKLWANRKVLKSHPQLAKFIVLRLLTVREWAVIKVFI